MRRRLASRVARGLLLVLLALGVYGMHTLGHVTGGHGGSPSAAHSTGVAQEPAHALAAALQSFAPEPGTPGLDPTSVCLAILTSFVAVLLATAWLRARRRPGAGGGAMPPARHVARPPPRPTSVRLASLSILRM
ncbi:DUF6153 family protein [Nonomuraea candida]|uniref:DUF6153 family protein n=1 Tax=Nonomuraea candida TaxID=359159 RepID=UPI0012F7271B|nr:DUF6153 family protein [Nonomuraea candida]